MAEKDLGDFAAAPSVMSGNGSDRRSSEHRRDLDSRRVLPLLMILALVTMSTWDELPPVVKFAFPMAGLVALVWMRNSTLRRLRTKHRAELAALEQARDKVAGRDSASTF